MKARSNYTTLNRFADCKDIPTILKRLDFYLKNGSMTLEEYKLLGEAMLRTYSLGLDAGTAITKDVLKEMEQK